MKTLLVALLLVAPGCDRDWAQPDKNTRATESGQPASAQQFDPTGLVCSDSRLEPFCERLCRITSTSDPDSDGIIDFDEDNRFNGAAPMDHDLDSGSSDSDGDGTDDKDEVENAYF